ncbi:hypothetical protein SEMRO_646_G180690.1 [Seminavis robusta]|uniref:Uncharacterized protein n=1 Tax=Seminavis robusta TaxID=568900 RepID=A0A9N8E467_9STRA|nr:hypothetical protein SEMRO_646_G180690.1 [Seminavis robusta]|eukprot:Sro646_g180690.1 n/a (369) ;mRNA; r:11064-12170
MLSTEECRWCDGILKDLLPDLVAQEQTIRAEFNATKSYKARTDRRLHTKLGLVSCTLLWDIRQFIIMAASPELDPRTFMLGNDTRSIRQRFLNDDLAALFHLPSFSKEPFGLLEQSILGRLRAKQSTAQLFTSETESNVERLLKQHIAGPIAQIYQLNQSTLADMRQMITRCCPDTFSSTISAVTPSPVARREEPNNDFPSEPSLTLADGRTPRKRRPKVHQQQAISQEYRRRAHESSDGNSRVDPVLLSDKGCKTFADYWKVWVDKWQQLETETEGAWRSDLNGSGGRRQWWSHRSPMFRLMQHLMTEKDMSEEQAVEEGTTIYNSISRKKGRDKPNIKDVGKRFKEELVKHGINLRGRPKGQRIVQ